jgi:hypothetical protein
MNQGLKIGKAVLIPDFVCHVQGAVLLLQLTVGGLSSAFSNAKRHPGNRQFYLLKNYPACT